MCFVVQNPLGKGAAAHPRCIPQAHGSVNSSSIVRVVRGYSRTDTHSTHSRSARGPCSGGYRPRQQDPEIVEAQVTSVRPEC